MTKIGIVGPEESKWTPEQIPKVKQWIKNMFHALGFDNVLVSGHCPKGGVDIWSEEIADELGIKKEIYPAEVNQWNDKVIIDAKSYDEHIITGAFHVIARSKRLKGYRSRNIQIAEACDILYCIVPCTCSPKEEDHPKFTKELEEMGIGWIYSDKPITFYKCKHCKKWGHPTNGGCWALLKAKELDKETHLVVIE